MYFLYPCVLVFYQQHLSINNKNNPKLTKLDVIESYKWLTKCLLFPKPSTSLTDWCDDEDDTIINMKSTFCTLKNI
jgi:hypothetical protein